MHGNVWEWVEDRSGEYFSSHVVDPKGVYHGVPTVCGGAAGWYSSECAASCDRLIVVGGGRVISRYADVGFRLMRIAKK